MDTTNQPYVSRRERRLQMREGRISDGGISKKTRRFLLWGGGLALLVLIGWGMIRLASSVEMPTGDGSLSDPVTTADHATGPADARVTLVEYSDFQCPACAAYYPLVKQLFEEPQLKDALRLVYRSFPLTNIHPNAQLAAQAAEAASVQGKFWEMHDMLFEKQTAWAGLSNKGARDVFVGYAKALGLDSEKFSSDIDSGASKDSVREQVATGTRSGVSATPTFYINGKKMSQPRSYEEFRQFILNALNANP